MIRRKDILNKAIDNLRTNYFNLENYYEKAKSYDNPDCEDVDEIYDDLVRLREEMRDKIIFLGILDIIRNEYVDYLIKIFKLNTKYMV